MHGEYESTLCANHLACQRPNHPADAAALTAGVRHVTGVKIAAHFCQCECFMAHVLLGHICSFCINVSVTACLPSKVTGD